MDKDADNINESYLRGTLIQTNSRCKKKVHFTELI